MEYLIPFFLLSSGFIMLFLGGELLVKSSLQFAKIWKVSSLFIGLTLVSIGTSAPELFASLFAVMEDKPNIAFGNIVGSNIFNLLMILGFTALVKPLVIQKSLMKFEWLFLSLSAAFFSLALKDSSILWYEGLFFLALFIIFLLLSFYQAQKKTFKKSIAHNKKTNEKKELKEKKKNSYPLYPLLNQLNYFLKKNIILTNLIFLILGIFLLGGGAKIAINGAIQIGKIIGLSETIIGIVIISIGTGLPELVTSMVAAFKSENDLALSNVIGSNIMNTLGITSFITLIQPIHFEKNILFQESLILLGITLVFFPLAWITKFIFKRKVGLLLLIVYAFYLWKLT